MATLQHARVEILSSAERLATIVNSRYDGEGAIVLANREPVTTARAPDGRITIRRASGGVVTALEPILQACRGVWVACGSGRPDESIDGRTLADLPSPGYRVRRVGLADHERRGHYDGFSNQALWPLCHRTSVRPLFRTADYVEYRAVNAHVAAAVCEEASSRSPLVLVQDYHFALAPQFIRARLPRSTIVAFWHIPWPAPDRFERCPWANQLLEGLLASTIVGFQTTDDCHNFLDVVERRLGTFIDRAAQVVAFGNRRIRVGVYPISIEWPCRWMRDLPDRAGCERDVRRTLRLPSHVSIGVGVDRMDYTKGIEEKFLAVERLLERQPELRGRFVFVQLAEPSREGLPAYREVRRRVRETAARINARFAAGRADPIVILEGHHQPITVGRFLRAADVCYVGSLQDGMNLVAKEFVAAREDEAGVLILSRFAGAARELGSALIIDPHDVNASADALASALRMPAAEQTCRMREMRRHVREFDVYRWAGALLMDAASTREARRERDARAGTSGLPRIPARADSYIASAV